MFEHARAHLDDRFRELYDRTYERVYAFVLRRISGADEARDVVGDTYMSVWRRIRDVPEEPAMADAWVFGTARRVISNHRRAHHRRDRLTERLMELRARDASSDPDEPDLLLRVLAHLSDHHREVLQLAMWDDLTNQQIAHILGCSENAVGIRLHRARAALRERYGALVAGGGGS